MRHLRVPQGTFLRLAHAKYLGAISYAMVKTDVVGAATMAQLRRMQRTPEAHMIREGTREVQRLPDGLMASRTS